MASHPNRTALLTKIHRVLKKHFKPAAPVSDRPLLEQLLYALCLENATHDAGEHVFAALETNFFDWNEIRVTTVKELAEAMPSLPNPEATAANLRRVLQAVFETNYSFEIESLRKLNLGQAVAKLREIPGSTAFSVAYVTQVGLGGHSIPLDQGALMVLEILGAMTPEEAKAGEVHGLERAIPKNKGIEFGSLLHQFGAELLASPYSANLHNILMEISPDAKARLPKRPVKKKPEAPAPPTPAAAPVEKEAMRGEPAKASAPARPTAAAKPGEKKKEAHAPAPAPPAKGERPLKKAPAASKKKPAPAAKPAHRKPR